MEGMSVLSTFFSLGELGVDLQDKKERNFIEVSSRSRAGALIGDAVN